jgi:ABC-type transporter MlaC component
VDDLRTFADLLERRRGGIRHARDAETRRDHETRIVRVVVALGDGTATPVEFPLRQEHGLWRIASIVILDHLATEGISPPAKVPAFNPWKAN